MFLQKRTKFKKIFIPKYWNFEKKKEEIELREEKEKYIVHFLKQNWYLKLLEVI